VWTTERGIVAVDRRAARRPRARDEHDGLARIRHRAHLHRPRARAREARIDRHGDRAREQAGVQRHGEVDARRRLHRDAGARDRCRRPPAAAALVELA
jgi:hypothetical protein